MKQQLTSKEIYCIMRSRILINYIPYFVSSFKLLQIFIYTEIHPIDQPRQQTELHKQRDRYTFEYIILSSMDIQLNPSVLVSQSTFVQINEVMGT